MKELIKAGTGFLHSRQSPVNQAPLAHADEARDPALALASRLLGGFSLLILTFFVASLAHFVMGFIHVIRLQHRACVICIQDLVILESSYSDVLSSLWQEKGDHEPVSAGLLICFTFDLFTEEVIDKKVK